MQQHALKKQTKEQNGKWEISQAVISKGRWQCPSECKQQEHVTHTRTHTPTHTLTHTPTHTARHTDTRLRATGLRRERAVPGLLGPAAQVRRAAAHRAAPRPAHAKHAQCARAPACCEPSPSPSPGAALRTRAAAPANGRAACDMHQDEKVRTPSIRPSQCMLLHRLVGITTRSNQCGLATRVNGRALTKSTSSQFV